MPVGTLALHTGSWPSIEEYGEFIRIVNKDHSGASAAIQKAFRRLSAKPAKKPASPSRLLGKCSRPLPLRNPAAGGHPEDLGDGQTAAEVAILRFLG